VAAATVVLAVVVLAVIAHLLSVRVLVVAQRKRTRWVFQAV